MKTKYLNSAVTQPVEITGGEVSLDVTSLDTDTDVGTTVTATAAIIPETEQHVHYEWLLTGDSDGLSLVWDNATDGSVATIQTVEGFDQVQSGVCSVTCTANGTVLDSADLTINRVEPAVLQASEPSPAAKTTKAKTSKKKDDLEQF